MGASDSKLVFKRGIFKLSEERHIAADDQYWTSFWQLPESPEDVFSLFAPGDIRRARDGALENIETLILALTSRLFALRHHPGFPHPDLAPEREALNCIRILTRILPFLHEKDSLSSWEERFFWGTRRKRAGQRPVSGEILFDESQNGDDQTESKREPDGFEEAKPLGEELVDTLVDLLFFTNFTIAGQQKGHDKVTYAIWQSGVGCHSAVPTTRDFESNRCEILRLLMTLAGQSMYTTAANLTQRGVRTLTHLCTCADKQVVLSVLCSLLNTTLKYNPASWRVPYNSLVFKDGKLALVTYSLQFLLTLLLYPIPGESQDTSQKNVYRHFFGRLHRPQDFQFIVDGITRILNQPLQEKSSYLPGSQTSTSFTPETLMLFWEITQCNKRFRSYIVDTDRAHDFVVLTLFYALEYKVDASKQGIVRMCAFLLQTLSVKSRFGAKLNKPFESQSSLPAAIRVNGFRGSYADFLVHSIYTLITKSQGKLSAVYPALLAVISNIAPYLEHLSASTSFRLMQLLASMSSPSFLLANESNHLLLHSLLESISTIVEHKFQSNPELAWAILKNRKSIEALRSFTLESGQAELERRNRRRKDSGSQVDPFENSPVRTSFESSPNLAHSEQAYPSEEASDDGAFAIGEDEDEDTDEDPQPTPAQSTASDEPAQGSSAANISDAVPVQMRGMSEKARGKMPAGVRSFSRQNSTTSIAAYSTTSQSLNEGFEPTPQWIETWVAELPLHSLLSLIQQVSVILPRDVLRKDAASPELLQRLGNIDLIGIEPSELRVHSFEWSRLALGWYESLLWGVVFSTEMQVAKGTLGVWNGTAIKLFRVQETAAQGPSLSSPRGAVDAVGSNIVSRIGQLNVRNSQTLPEPEARSLS